MSVDPPASVNGPEVAGILLAAGTSSRMGANKLLLELDGETILRGAARRALAGGLAPLLVVLGHQAERTRAELHGLACEAVVNPDFEEGITASLRCGLAALPEGVEAAMVLLADMPRVTAAMIAAMVVRFRAVRPRLVISDYAGVQAPPMLYDRTLFAELAAMDDGRCGRQVVERHRNEAAVLSFPAPALTDLDVPADYELLRQGVPP